jgi:hypothetical protein
MIEIGPTSKVKLSIDMAWLYCATLTHDEKYNWRMPTYNERWNSISGSSLTWDSDEYASGPVYNILTSHKVIPVRDSDK